MSLGSYQLPCGCKVERGAERIVDFCDGHGTQYLEIRKRALADHAAENPRVLASGGLPVSEFQSNIRTGVHP